jgi:hypothetical protein
MVRIEVLRCAGNHHAMGVAQGKAFREPLRALHLPLIELAGLSGNQLLSTAVSRVGRPVARLAGRVGSRLMARDLAEHYPEQYERMVGIAEGAGIPLHRLFLGPAVELALNQASYQASGACTAIAVTGERSADGEPVIGKNFDYPDVGRDLYLVRRSRPGGLAASVDVSKAPLSGSHEGVNAYGLAVAYNYGYFRGRGQARVTISNLVQELLELCHEVGDAIEYLRGRPRTGGALLMLADQSGAVAAVEMSADRLAVRRPGREGWLVHTNHAQTDELRAVDLPAGAVSPRWYPKGLRGLPLQVSSARRLARASALLAAAPLLDRARLAAILADHGETGRGDDQTICRHGPFYTTTCSVLLYPRRRAVEVMFGPPCGHQYTTVYLSEQAEGRPERWHDTREP